MIIKNKHKIIMDLLNNNIKANFRINYDNINKINDKQILNINFINKLIKLNFKLLVFDQQQRSLIFMCNNI